MFSPETVAAFMSAVTSPGNAPSLAAPAPAAPQVGITYLPVLKPPLTILPYYQKPAQIKQPWFEVFSAQRNVYASVCEYP